MVEVEEEKEQEKLLGFAHRLADAAGEVIRPWFRAPIEVTDKGTGRAGFDPVTVADQEAEAVMRRMIKATYPTHGIVGEEHGRDEAELGGASTRLTWVLDPIDGTRAFICGQAQWGTLIALNDGERPILGILDQPITRERWIGRHGHGAEIISPDPVDGVRKTKTIRTRPCESIASAILMTTHPTAYFDAYERAAYDRVAPLAKMTRFGGDCYMYGLLAMGFIDLVVEASLKSWDVQALIPIVEGAGGLLTSWDGGDAQNGGRVVAAGDARVHAEALAILRS